MQRSSRQHATRTRAERARAGFTLLELLVVIAIMSLLMSILTPSLSRARQQAKSTVCLTRLREFMHGVTSYATDHEFLLPPASYTVSEVIEEPPLHGWAEVLYENFYGDRAYDMDADYPVQRNIAGAYELWVCKEALPRAGSSGHYRVYEEAWQAGSLDGVKPKLPLIIDANPLVTFPEDLRRSDIPKERIAGLQGEAYIDERHYGGANYVFNDGHAIRSTSLKEQLALDWDLNPETPNE